MDCGIVECLFDVDRVGSGAAGKWIVLGGVIVGAVGEDRVVEGDVSLRSVCCLSSCVVLVVRCRCMIFADSKIAFSESLSWEEASDWILILKNV